MSQPKTEKREVRQVIQAIELRAAPAGSDSPGTLIGYAAVFETYSADLGYFREKIQKGAFAKAIANSDTRALANHDPSQLLGRKSAGTLRMAEDDFGLKVEIDLPNTTSGRDTAESIKRGDMQGQSFCFTTSIDQWDWSGETVLRTVIEVDELWDVGPVTYPAYEETSVALRSLQSEKEKRDRDAAATAPHLIESERDQARLRLLEVS
jgi:hypothetical protein